MVQNFTKFIMWSLVYFRSMTKTNVANKLVYFRTNGVIVFQGFKNGVTTKLMQNHVPFMSGALYGTLHKLGCLNFEQFEFSGKNQKIVCIYAQLFCPQSQVPS
jgi:hypothetical protein